MFYKTPLSMLKSINEIIKLDHSIERHSRMFPCDHSSKRPASLATGIVIPRLNCHSISVH